MTKDNSKGSYLKLNLNRRQADWLFELIFNAQPLTINDEFEHPVENRYTKSFDKKRKQVLDLFLKAEQAAKQ